MIKSMYEPWNQPKKTKEEQIEEMVNRLSPKSGYDGDLLNWTERHLMRAILGKVYLSGMKNEIQATLDLLKSIIMKKCSDDYLSTLFDDELLNNKYVRTGYTTFLHENSEIRTQAAKNAYLHIISFQNR